MKSTEKVNLSSSASSTFAPQLVGLVTTIDALGKPNVATIAWVMSTSHNPELMAISVSPLRYTHSCLTDEFVINLPTVEILREVWLVGSTSGRDIDKFALSGLTPIPSQVVIPPRIAQCCTHIECKIVGRIQTGDHTIFIGQVVAKSGDVEALVDGILSTKIAPLFHLGGTKFLVGNIRIDVHDL